MTIIMGVIAQQYQGPQVPISGLLNSTSNAMDKKKVDTCGDKPSFFEIFKSRCSESDLGPISLNWFEELSSEAPPYDFKRLENPEHNTICLDQSTFKTPKGKLSTNSPSASTPMIFKEQNKTVPLFASPIKELGQSNTETGEYFALLRGGLLRTPKLFEAQTQKCISESLGAQVDPDMSWSSSLATPPTLSPTVVIDRGNDSRVSGTKQHNERLELIMRGIFSKYSRSLKKISMNMQSASRIEDVCAETPSKIHSRIPAPVGSDDRGLTRSGLKTISSLSNLKRRPKKFIYTVNNSPVYLEEGTTQKDGSSCPVPNYTDLRSCISEVSVTAIRNEGKTEKLSSTNNHTIEEKQQVRSGFLSNCTLMNISHETQCNEKSSTESNFTSQSSIPLQIDSRRETVMLPSHVTANLVTESNIHKFHTVNHKDTLDKEYGGKYDNLANLNSLQEAVFEDSTLAMQASKSGNNCAALELVTQHSLASCTPFAELGFQSKKVLQPATDESSTLIKSGGEIYTKQPLPLDLKENANKCKQRWLGCANQSKNQSFDGFKTASNKQIALSDNDIRKSKLLFKDIEDQFLEGFPSERMKNTSNQNTQETAEISSVGRSELNENSSNFSHVSDSLMNLIQFDNTQSIFPECSNMNVLKNAEPEGKNLTASQEAEVTELSNILEETGSQFEFTQFKKHRTVVYNNTCEMSGSFDKDGVNSEMWKDIDFGETFEDKVPRGNVLSPHKHISTTEEYKIQTQSSEEITSMNSRSREQNKNVPAILAPLQSEWGYCNSTSGKEMNIPGETINKVEKYICDLDGVNEILIPQKTNFQTDCSNSGNNHNYMKEICDWHHMAKQVGAQYMIKNNTKDTITNIKNKSKVAKYNEGNVIQITSTTEVNLKIVKTYSIQMTGNELPSTENNRSVLVAQHFVNCGETKCNYNLQETLSDLTCLAEVAKTDTKITLNDTDEKETLNSSQKEEFPGSHHLLQSFHTVADENILAANSKMFNLLGGSYVKEEQSSNGKTGARSKKGAISSMKKSTDLSENKNLFVTNHQKVPEARKEKQTSAFHTASGKQITVTDESLAKARHLLSEETVIPEKVDDVKPSFHIPIKEKRNEEITKVRQEFGEGTEKHEEVLNPEGNFKDPLEPLSNTVKRTENFETVKRLSLEMNVSESNNILAHTSNKNDTSKTSFFDTDQHLYVEEKSDACVKQNLQPLSSRNTSNVLTTKINKKLDSLDIPCNTTSKASYSDLKSGQSALHHSHDACNERNSIPENFTCISEDVSSSNSFNAENNVSILKGTSKNESYMSQLRDLELLDNLDTNILQKYSASEAAASTSKLLKARPVAFNTASGKTVEVSQEALKKARQLLHKDCCKSIKQNMACQSETSKLNISESCSEGLSSGECVTTSNYLSVETIPVGSSVAHHFPCAKEYYEDEQALECTGSMSLKTLPESSCQTSCVQMNDKCSDTWNSNKLNCIKSDLSTDNCGLFSTASGKPVQLSEESLKKARQLFSEMENESSGHRSRVSDCDYSYGEASLVRNKASATENKLLLPQGKRFPYTEVNSNIPCGFSTASGKQVQISQKALQSVMGLLKEFDDVNSNGFSVDQQNLGQGHILPTKAPAADAKVSSNSKPQEKCNAFYLPTRNPNEKKTSKNLLSIKIPSYLSHTEKYNRMETKYATKFDIVTKENLDFHSPDYTQTPENYLEIEASESAKAFMKDDDLIDSEIRKNKKESILSSERTNNFLSNSRTGKRHMEEENTFGEPSIKRKLLPEFDKSDRSNRSSLKASKSTPDGTMNDRKKFTFNIPLKPVICGPFSSTKERQEFLNPNLTTPDQDPKRSKSDGFQQDISKQSSSRSDLFTAFSKVSIDESKKMENYHRAKQPVKVFVPPFKTKSSAPQDEIGISKESVLLGNKVINRIEELNPEKDHESTIEPEKDNSAQISAVDWECEDAKSDLTKIIANLHYARNLQEIRIMKKQKQRIHPQPGSLYLVKMSSAPCRVPLKVAVEEKLPHAYFSEQLYAFGISRQCLKINSRNAEDFQFIIQDFFSRQYFLERHGIQLADGGYLIPSDDGTAGKEEFYRALCDTPGVDQKLISKAWVYNHYRWIIWKLAAMEVAFPQEFANKCLTPERVLLQLKYRYDVEVDKSHRSAIKRITERDDVAAKTMILCISKIISLSANMSQICGNKNTAGESKKDVAVVEVTDGWYGIRAVLDPRLQSLLNRQRLMVGQKIVVHGAELVGSPDATTPLEAPESLMLKISANSTRRARWYAKLGYYRDPRPFSLPLSSLLSDGGTVGCIDVIIQRIYPTQWMEKVSTGSYVFRNCRAEEREAAKHAENRQKTLETLLAKIQAEFEKNEDEGKRVLRSRALTRQQIRSLQDGADLYEAILKAADPAYMESYFSEEQLKALNNHRQMVNDKKQAQIEAEFRKAVESTEQEEHNSCRRDVSTLIKLRIVDYRKEEKEKEIILNIWRPSSDVCNILKEGGRYRIFQLGASQSKSKTETTNIQLTATKKTQYLQLPVSEEILSQVYQPRECLRFSELLGPSFQPACSEVDLVGYIVSLRRGTGFSTLVYLSDKSHTLIAIQICTDLKQLAIEDIIIPSVLISATNLQWRPEFRSSIPTLFSGGLSAFSSNPKENHLQGIFNELKYTIENDSCFGKDAHCKLMNLLQVDGPQVFNLPKQYGLDPFSSPWKTGAANKQSIATPSSERRHHSPLMLGKLNSKAPVSLGSEKITPELQETPKNCKKRKAMDLLCQVPSPPPVKPICTFISPSLKKAFQPPRSSGTQHEQLLKRTECKVKIPSQTTLNETDFPLENNFVADEELAMINTQALLSNFPVEREIASMDETMYEVCSDSPHQILLRNNSFQYAITKNILQDSTEEIETPAKETNSSLAVCRKLQRQRKRK
ncbi:breast cancer type 2 susceptibility protein [Elgaria multicarinata webbii]|uniref:breast cancer type 2 susceptibility protein n=1 Tax=Elgaria multicarinata webbii TaxID=159646 RepID=UPI002FCD360C